MNHALCVGIDQYADAAIAPPLFCERDARGLAAVLSDRFGFAASLSINPDSSSLLQALERTVTKLRAGDKLVLSFSGHGLDRWSHAGSADQLLLAADAKTGLLEHDCLQHLPGVLSLKVAEALTRVPGVARLFLLDTCRSSVGPGKPGVRSLILRRSRPASSTPSDGANHLAGAPESPLTVLLATQAGGWSFTLPLVHHGLFSYTVMQLLGSGLGPAQEFIMNAAWVNEHLQPSMKREAVRFGLAECPKPCLIGPAFHFN